MAAGKQLSLFVAHRVDAVHHRLIGGKNAVSRVVVFLLAKIRHGKLRQQIDEAPLRLRNEGIAVGQEQDILRPALLQKHLAESDDRPRLAAARRVPNMAGNTVRARFADGFNGMHLVRPQQNQLLAVAVDEQKRVLPVIPVHGCHHKTDGGKGGLHQRENYLEKCAVLACSVYSGRVHEFIGNAVCDVSP